MIGELAPLALWLRYVLKPGDVLIIDEPEAHLHPENQRWIAQILVRLIRKGIHVVCTTHSSIILHQLSNQLIASSGDSKKLSALGYESQDVLALSEIGVFLFGEKGTSTTVTKVPIDAEVGIDEEEFVKVMEALGEETYKISQTVDID